MAQPALDADHGLPLKTERHWIGHGGDLHDPAVDETLHPQPGASLGQADSLADGAV